MSLAAFLVGCSADSSGETPAAPWAPGPQLSCRYTLVESNIGSVDGYSTSWQDRKPTCEGRPCSAVRAPLTSGGFGVYTSYSLSEKVDLVGSCESGAPAACGDRKGGTACETAVFASCCANLVIAEQDANEKRILDCVAMCTETDAECPKACVEGAPAESVKNLQDLAACVKDLKECATP